MSEVKFKVFKDICTLSDNEKAVSKLLRVISWQDGEPKVDIRAWSGDRKKPYKGIGLNATEAATLLKHLAEAIECIEGE